MKQEMRVQVRDMKKGDVLVPTNREILDVWGHGSKRNVQLRKVGFEATYVSTFGAYTMVTIEREVQP